MAFFQSPPQLGNSFHDDPLLQEWIALNLNSEQKIEASSALDRLGELATQYYKFSLGDRENEPTLTQWDAWGNRIDSIKVSPLWQMAERTSVEEKLVAIAYDPSLGPAARIHWALRNFVIQPSFDIYGCPLAMTDGAVRTLLDSGNQELIDKVVPKLLSSDFKTAWTSGQWMTERTGGSDVGLSETRAELRNGEWYLYGTKWFTSATTSNMALTLARPSEDTPGGRGLALFFVELRDENGRLRNIEVNRLKDKLGTRKVPTAELTLNGTPATLVSTTSDGIRAIAPMLSVTRSWNTLIAAALMRRGLALAEAYAQVRHAFGATLAQKPLHQDTLWTMRAECEGAFHLSLFLASLLGKAEHRQISDEQNSLLRILSSIAKLTTAKQAVEVISEAIECFGGAGYVEDTGLPRLLADAHVLPIWEGTTNVLSLDAGKQLRTGGFEAWNTTITDLLAHCDDVDLMPAVTKARACQLALTEWLLAKRSPEEFEASLRRVALSMGRTLELTLLCHHAQAMTSLGRSYRAIRCATRFSQSLMPLVEERVVAAI